MNNMIPSSKARDEFTDILSHAEFAKRRTIISRRGKPIAAVVPMEDLERWQLMEDAKDAEKIELAMKEEEFEAWDTAKKELSRHFGFTQDELQATNLKKS